MTKKAHLIRFFSILALFPVILLLGSAEASAKNNSNSPIYLPLVLKDYESWSTNFADVTDPAARNIYGFGTDASLSLDTTNVNSGGKSLKLTGTVGPVGSWMYLTFNFPGLTQASSIDFSDKTIYLDLYVPPGSPLSTFLVEVHSTINNGTDQFVILRRIHPDVYLGQWHTYAVDVREDITLKTWRNPFTPADIPDDQAVNILKNAQDISIYPMVMMDHPSQQTYFMVDQIGWATSGPQPAYNPAVDSLREHASPSLPVGGYIDYDGASDPDYLPQLLQEFNLYLPEDAFPKTEPPGDVFTYDSSWSPSADADYFHDTYGIPLIRHSGIGQNPDWIPDWLPGKSYPQAQSILEQFIGNLVSHYKGKTYAWFLFNELLRYDLVWKPYTGLGLKDNLQTPQTAAGNYSPWSNSPSDLTMIEDAFHIARLADPDTLLFINDGCAVEGQPYGDALYNLAARLKSDGTPIDGVGLQTHLFLAQDDHFYTSYEDPKTLIPFDPVYGFTDIAENVERYAALGLKVIFSEADIPIYLDDIDLSTQAGRDLLAHRRQLQAAAYRSLLHIARTHPNVVAFVNFDWADEYTYTDPGSSTMYPGYGKDLGLMDQVYQKKPAYAAMLAELKATPGALPAAFDRSSPAEAATDQPTSLTLRWNPSAGATGYQYCLIEGLSDHCDAWTSTGASTSVSLDGLKLNTRYSWQVQALGSGGVTHADGGNWGTFTTANGSDWSTNFASMTDLSGRGIYGYGDGASLSLDQSNVNSGGQSVKLAATIGAADSVLDLGLWTDQLLGKPTFDFTHKTISYEVYLPADSPLDTLDFYFGKDSNFVDAVVATGADLYKGQWHTYSVDISQFIADQGWKASGWTNCTTDDQVLYVLKNATNINLWGTVWSDHSPALTYLLLDQVGWASSPSSATNLAKDGAAMASSSLDNSTLPANAVDGDVTTRWTSTTTGSQWLQVDLGSVQSIQKFVLDWEGSNYASSYQIEVSNNGSDWTSVYSTTIGSGYVESLPVSTSGRYVRLVLSATSSTSGCSLWEFEVYGSLP